MESATENIPPSGKGEMVAQETTALFGNRKRHGKPSS